MGARELTEFWRAAFDRLAVEEKAEGPRRGADGGWTMELHCTLTTAARVASRLPGEFELVPEHIEEMLDRTGGAVDIEIESSLWASDAERATVVGHDHWQAGFSGVVTLYAEEASYKEAVESGKRRLMECAGTIVWGVPENPLPEKGEHLAAAQMIEWLSTSNVNKTMLRLRGVVDGGQRYMRLWYTDNQLLSTALGAQLRAGSINVFVGTTDRPELFSSAHPFFRAQRDEAVDPGNILKQGFFYVRDCQLNGHAAFMLRTEHPGKAYDGPGKVVPTRLPQPNTMFEIVAPQISGISYGAEVDLVFDPDPAKLRVVRVR